MDTAAQDRRIARYNLPVPRYTSYPTAPHFGPAVTTEVYRRWLAGLARAGSLSLYVHVPFCARLCWFCGCHTRVINAYEPVAEYVGVVLDEARAVAAAIGAAPPVRHVHWGGGTPSNLRDHDVLRLADGLHRAFPFAADAEFAVEIDPRTLTAETVTALAAAGVNRASLGVQDFDPSVQAAINRHQTYAMTATAVEALRRRGIRRVNIDLMYGLPGQTVAGIERTVDQAVTLSPDRLALFGYAHVPWLKKHQRLIDESRLPDGGARFRQAVVAAERLVGHGYVAIGLDHFARPDDALAIAARNGGLRRNFQGYTTDAADALIGLGASAIGALPEGYVQNVVAIAEYAAAVHAGRLATARGVVLDADDRLRRDVIERLMCDLAVDLATIAARHGVAVDAFDDDVAALDPMVDDGLVTIEGSRVGVTEAGRPFLRVAAAAFDRHARAGVARHARAV
ncbi:MAG: oxygen-independent coproporphyrinogen III oxidase [Alphaproteobacteria bacterium]